MRLENPADQTSLILACHDFLLVGVFWGVGFFGFFFKKQTQTQKIQFWKLTKNLVSYQIINAVYTHRLYF